MTDVMTNGAGDDILDIETKESIGLALSNADWLDYGVDIKRETEQWKDLYRV